MSSTPPSSSPPVSLIVGCGFVGRRLAPLLIKQGQVVYATTRHEANTAALAKLGARPLLVDVMQPLTFAAMRDMLDAARTAERFDVYYLVPPGRPGGDPSPPEVIMTGGQNVIAFLLHALREGDGQGGDNAGALPLRRVVIASSTGVYSQCDGQVVTADTDPAPQDPRAKLLFAGEQLWLESGLPARVVRLAGLYGPGRVIGLQAVRDEAPLAGDPDATLNLIHGDDAAALLYAVAGSEHGSTVELGCDGNPTRRLAYYQHLAERLGKPAPRLITPEQAEAMKLDTRRLQRSTSKVCDPAPTMQRTGWTPRYRSYYEGLAEVEGLEA